MDKSVGDGRLQRLLKAKKQKQDPSSDGRHSFFHNLIGNQPEAMLIIPSDDEDSDPGFYRRHRVNVSSVQTAVHLKTIEIDMPKGKSTTDKSQLKLPRIDSPVAGDTPDKFHSKSSNDVVKLPDIHESSQLHRRPRLEQEKGVSSRKKREKMDEPVSQSDIDEPKYPWESNRNRDIRNESLTEKKLKKSGKPKPQVDLSHFSRDSQPNEDLLPPYGVDDQESLADIEDNDDGHETASNSERKRKKKRGSSGKGVIEGDEKEREGDGNKQTDSNVDGTLLRENDPVSGGSKKENEESKEKSQIPSSSSRINHTKTKKSDKISTTSKSPNGSTHTTSSRRTTAKYNPRTKKGEFPWERKSRNEPKPKTALVRPTRRDDLNIGRFPLKRKKTFVKSNTMKKYENVDSHFPSRVELRLMARRAKLQKERPATVKPKRLRPLVSKKLFTGFGSVDERLQKRRERKEQNNKKPNFQDDLRIRRADNIAIYSVKGPHYGSVRTEIRSMKKKFKAKQKEEERQKKEEKEKREKKAKVPVYMPPVHRDKVVTYGDNYHYRKSQLNSSHTTKPNTTEHRTATQKTSHAGSKHNSPKPIGHDDDIWDYFASVVDNLKSIEAKQRIEEEEKYRNTAGLNQHDLPPQFAVRH